MRLLFAPILFIIHWFRNKVLYDTDAFESLNGIVIAEFGPKKDRDPAFVSETKGVLEFLATHDTLGLKRVQKYLGAIVNVGKSTNRFGRYWHYGRVCYIYFSNLGYDRSRQDAKKLYARILVHEATHGRIETMGIRCNLRTRKRIESICIKEELRLSRRFRDGAAKKWEQIIRREMEKI